MSLGAINNSVLNKMYTAAKDALNSTELSKEDSVIHSYEDGAKISGHKWVVLGRRSDEFKAANTRTRQQFFENITGLFGGKDNLPPEVLKEFKMKDFQLDDFNNVKSNRPLTARRIIAICEKANESIKAKIAGKVAELETHIHEYVAGYNDLSESDQAELLAKIKGQIHENPLLDVRTVCESTKNSVNQFMCDSIRELRMAVENVDVSERMRPITTVVTNLGRLFKTTSTDILSSIKSMLKSCLELDGKALKCVIENCANRSPAEKAFVFNKFVTGFINANFQNLGALDNNCYDFSNIVINKCQSAEEFAVTFDFTAPISKEELEGVKNDPQVVYRFMRAYVDQHKTEYSNEAGGQNDQLGEKSKKLNERSKYDNIVATIDQAIKLVEANLGKDIGRAKAKMEIFTKWFTDPKREFFRIWVSSVHGKLDADLEIPDDLLDEYRGHVPGGANAAKDVIVNECKFFLGRKSYVDAHNKQVKAEGKGEPWPLFPFALTTNGKGVADVLERITGVSSHKYSNTVDQFQLANDVFRNIDSLFLKCLEKDAANGNTKFFDQLMDAMNMPGCLQFRIDPILTLKTELELGVDLNVKAASQKDSVMDGVGKKVYELCKANGNKPVKYENAIKAYVDSVGNGAEIKLDDLAGKLKKVLKNDNDFVINDYDNSEVGITDTKKFFADNDRLADLEKGTVKVSKEFFALEFVKREILDSYGDFME